MNLYQKLLEIQKQVHGLGKDSKTYSYGYTSGSKVLKVIRPLMDQYGLLLKPEIIDTYHERIDYITAKGAQKSEMFIKQKMRFTWIDSESGEMDINLIDGIGMNDWDKGSGSAQTYAERYFFLKFFHISTDEDDSDYLTLIRQQEESEREKAKKDAEEKAKKDPLPSITQKALDAAVARLVKGENILDKMFQTYTLTDAQKTLLQSSLKK